MSQSCSDVVMLLTELMCRGCSNRKKCDEKEGVDLLMECMQTGRLIVDQKVVPDFDKLQVAAWVTADTRRQ